MLRKATITHSINKQLRVDAQYDYNESKFDACYVLGKTHTPSLSIERGFEQAILNATDFEMRS